MPVRDSDEDTIPSPMTRGCCFMTLQLYSARLTTLEDTIFKFIQCHLPWVPSGDYPVPVLTTEGIDNISQRVPLHASLGHTVKPDWISTSCRGIVSMPLKIITLLALAVEFLWLQGHSLYE